MENIQVDMRQYDCPFIDTTDDHAVSFRAHQWDFNTASRELETRIMVQADDRGALENGLDALGDHRNMHEYSLLSKKEGRALLRTTIAETNAMHVVRENEGYITGPFEIRDGSERWHLGFDTAAVADSALSDLERENDFDVESRDPMDLDDYHDVMQHIDAMSGMLDACRNLSTVERETLVTAVREGYFDTPREATLETVGDAFGVSDTAASKNLRRAEKKVLAQVADSIDDLSEE